MLKVFNEVNKLVIKYVDKANSNKVGYRDLLIAESEQDKLKNGIIIKGSCLIMTAVWIFDSAKLNDIFKITPFKIESLMKSIIESDYEKVTSLNTTRKSNYYGGKKDLVQLITGTGKQVYISGDYFNFFKADYFAGDITIKVKDEKSPVLVKWYDDLIGYMLPVRI